MIKRRRAKAVKIGSIKIGGDNPIAIQSMAKTKTSNVEETIKQIKELERAGCEIVRVAVKDSPDALAIRRIKKSIKIPLVADIHFNWRNAVEAIDSGADKVRLNPGNIYKKEEIKEVVSAAKANGIPIRVGVNSGSLRRVHQVTKSPADRMVKSTLDYIRILEKFNFFNIVISLKASNILDTIGAYRKIAKLCSYPLHLGVTATGLPQSGAIKSSIALGILLAEGIGDTIRVSLTEEPCEEVRIAQYILESLALRNFGPEIISCPTCGRCEVDLISVVKGLEEKLQATSYKLKTKMPLKVAIMGCVVNGPGEVKEANLGVAFGKSEGLLFKKGRAVRKVNFSECADVLLKELEKIHV